MFTEGTIPVIFFADRDQIVAYSPALDLSTCASTKKGAHKMFAEASRLFFEELERAGTTGEVLTGLGWKKRGKTWFAPKLLGVDQVAV